MKKIFAFILSLQLVILPVGLAAENETPAAPDVGTNAAYDSKSQAKSGGYDFYAKQILAISTSILGANIISQCSLGLKIPSVATFMSGSLVHIASEMAGAKAQNDNHNKRMEDLKIIKEKLARAGGQVQKESLEQRLKEEIDTRDFVKKRLMWTAATAVIYGVAAGLAISEEISGNAAGFAVGAPVCTSLAAACGLGAPGCLATCMGTLPTGAIAANASFALPPAVSGTPACTAVTPYSPACFAFLGAYLSTAYANCIPWTPASGLLGKLMVTAVIGAYSQGVAGSASSTAKYVVLLTSLLGSIVPSLQQVVMAAYNYPIPRSITFGASSALTAVVTVGLNQRKNLAEDNIKKLQEVLKQFKLQTDDPNGVDLGSAAGVANNANQDGSELKGLDGSMGTKAYAIKRLPIGTSVAKSKNCMSATAKSFEYSSKSCSSPMKLSRPNFDFKHGVKSLNDLGIMANDMANAVSSGDSEKADLLAGQLANQAARVDAINKSLQKKLNEKRKAEKSKELDFDQAISNKIASLGSAYNSAAAAKGISPSNFGNAGGVADVSSGKDSQDDKNSENNLGGPGDAIFANNPAMVLPSSSNGDLSGIDDGVNQDMNSDGSSSKVASLSESLNNYESSAEDIAKDPEVSIFKQLSNRYILNYSKILNRKPKVLETEQ